MKNTLKILLLQLTVCLASCGKKDPQSFLSGTFVNQSAGMYSIADDTLKVEGSGGNNFSLHRRTGFNLLVNGRPGGRQYEREEWQAVYEASSRTLLELRKGKRITVFADSGFIRIGKRKYIKIN